MRIVRHCRAVTAGLSLSSRHSCEESNQHERQDHLDSVCTALLAIVATAVTARSATAQGDGSVLVVRLSGDIFGTWSCNGSLREAYRETSSGLLTKVSPPEFHAYENRYPLEAYANTLTRRILAKSG